MALKGKPRDMKKWREVLLDPNVHFPGESSEYRRARNELLEAEAELRRLNEQVAAQRRALPAGGLIREDYVLESAADGGKVRFSELFAPGKNSLVIYNMMFPRSSEDPRAGARGQDSRAAACRTAVPVMHIGRRRARGCCFSPRRADQPRRDREDKPRSTTAPAPRTRLAQPAAAVLAEQHLQPRLPCGSTGRRAAPGPERVLTRRGRDPPPLGERDDVQARRHQLPRPGLANLRRSRFDARGTRRQRSSLSEPSAPVGGLERALALFQERAVKLSGGLRLD